VTHIIPEALTFDRVVDFDQFSTPNASKELDTVQEMDSSSKLFADDQWGSFAESSV